MEAHYLIIFRASRPARLKGTLYLFVLSDVSAWSGQRRLVLRAIGALIGIDLLWLSPWFDSGPTDLAAHGHLRMVSTALSS